MGTPTRVAAGTVLAVALAGLARFLWDLRADLRSVQRTEDIALGFASGVAHGKATEKAAALARAQELIDFLRDQAPVPDWVRETAQDWAPSEGITELEDAAFTEMANAAGDLVLPSGPLALDDVDHSFLLCAVCRLPIDPPGMASWQPGAGGWVHPHASEIGGCAR